MCVHFYACVTVFNSLTLPLYDRFLRISFVADLFTRKVFATNLLREEFIEEMFFFFFIFRFDDANPDFACEKPMYYLLLD